MTSFSGYRILSCEKAQRFKKEKTSKIKFFFISFGFEKYSNNNSFNILLLQGLKILLLKIFVSVKNLILPLQQVLKYFTYPERPRELTRRRLDNLVPLRRKEGAKFNRTRYGQIS